MQFMPGSHIQGKSIAALDWQLLAGFVAGEAKFGGVVGYVNEGLAVLTAATGREGLSVSQ